MFYSPKRKYVPDNESSKEKENEMPKRNENENKDNKEEDNLGISLNQIEEYEVDFNEEKYNLKAGYSKEIDSISIKITPLDSKNKTKDSIIFYEGLFSSQDLIKLCKSFRMYDSIEEIFSAICVIFENKKAYLKQNDENEKDNDIFYLLVIVGSPTGKEDELCLNLTKKEIKIIEEEKKEKDENQNNFINNLQCNCQFKEKEKEINSKIEKIEKDLKAENYELKNEIFYLKDDINRYKKTMDSNKKEIKKLKEQIKELKNSFERQLKELSAKINIINSNNINNINDNANTNSNEETKKNPIEVINANKETNTNKNTKNNNNNNKTDKTTNFSAISKKDLNQPNKNNNNNQKKNSKPLACSASVIPKNQEKKVNNKREIYQQMKAANAKNLNNKNKEKISFGEFLKQRQKNASGNKLVQSIEVKEPSKENKKVLQKNNTDFLPSSSQLKVNKSDVVNRNILENKKEIEKIEKEDEINYKEEEESEEKDFNKNEYLSADDESNHENNDNDNDNERNEAEKENDYEIQNIKTNDFNRGDRIDQWKFDFDLNVKKLLQDNENKLKLAEKLNGMNRRIINNIDELQLIENQLYKDYPDIKDIEYTLLYRATEHGDKSEVFHEKCDNVNFTLTIVRNVDGTKFGAYTEESWEGKNNKKDYHSFCFSLTKKKIYNAVPEKNIIICDPALAPSFGGPLFKIFDSFFTKGGKCYSKNKCGYNGQDNDFEITNGIEDFEIDEIEVYQLNLN